MPKKLKTFKVYLMRTVDIFDDIRAVDTEAACKQVLENESPDIFTDLPWHIEAHEQEEE
ncbi:MAG: hypothetical protein ACYSW3_24595 [Planctomycetota bacterium]|jgi:hypothetical protein